MKARPIVRIDEDLCDGCGLCMPSCAENALVIENGKVRILEDRLCDGLGACLGACPKGALQIEERLAPAFEDPHASVTIRASVSGNKSAQNFQEGTSAQVLSCSSQKIFEDMNRKNTVNEENILQELLPRVVATPLHWPIKFSLAPVKRIPLDKKLLLVADCACLACTNFSQRYVKDDMLPLLLCPRLENKDTIVAKMQDIFAKKLDLVESFPESFLEITLVRMEVPCCCLPDLVLRALKEMGASDRFKVHTRMLTLNGMEKISLM